METELNTLFCLHYSNITDEKLTESQTNHNRLKTDLTQRFKQYQEQEAETFKRLTQEIPILQNKLKEKNQLQLRQSFKVR